MRSDHDANRQAAQLAAAILRPRSNDISPYGSKEGRETMITDSEAPPPTEAEKNEGEAAAVTATVQANLDRARVAIDEAQKINALGIFVDRAETLAKIGDARRALNDAFYLLSTASWPPQRTYERIDQ